MKTKLLILGLCLAFLSAFAPVGVSARPPCEKVWVEGHYNKHGKWIKPHWKKLHWIKGHYDHHGRWIEGHCG
jgi:hypothetical protein